MADAQDTSGRVATVYASFWERLLGLIIDSLVLWAALSPLIFVGVLVRPDSDLALTSLGLLAVLAIQGAYFVVLLHRYGCTIGGKAMGIRCVDESGNWPSWRASLTRFAVPAGFGALQAVPVLGVLAGIGGLLNYLWMLWDPRKQCLMDKAAGTFVVKAASAPTAPAA